MNNESIKQLINSGDFDSALLKFEEEIFQKHSIELLNEYIYFKRMLDFEFTGKDLYLLMKSSDKNDLIISHVDEYCASMDNILVALESLGIESPLSYLKKNAPTMRDLINARTTDFNNSICLDSTSKNIFYSFCEFYKNNFDYIDICNTFDDLNDKCYPGLVFDKYPNQIQYCRDIFPMEPQIYYGVWVNCPHEHYIQIVENELNIKAIIVFVSQLWKWNWFKKKEHEPDFKDLKVFEQIDTYYRGGIEIKNIELEYTGRNHNIQNSELCEVNINIIRHKCFRGGFYEYSENPFTSLLRTIYREAENKFRVNHGLPKIGEGWISEMILLNLIKKYFSNTLHQASPAWLKPQHLDIYVSNKKIAFEYQGRQHFEPIDFFGGLKSFEKQKKLDKKKYSKCKNKNVKLIYWRFDEEICEDNLIAKLSEHNIKIPKSIRDESKKNEFV